MSSIYLDWAATTPPDPDIQELVRSIAQTLFANPSALHGPGRAAEKGLSDCRRRMADLLGCQPAELLFTSGATEANNMVLFSLLHKKQDRRGVPDPERPPSPRCNTCRDSLSASVSHYLFPFLLGHAWYRQMLVFVKTCGAAPALDGPGTEAGVDPLPDDETVGLSLACASRPGCCPPDWPCREAMICPFPSPSPSSAPRCR